LKLLGSRYCHSGKSTSQFFQYTIKLINDLKNPTIGDLRDKIKTLLETVRRLTIPIGSFDNALKYLKQLNSKLYAAKLPYIDSKARLQNAMTDYMDMKINSPKEMMCLVSI
jgi:hypothetical protein